MLTFLHLGALSTWFGAMVFWSFVATPKIFATHERRNAGDLVGLIFPGYYMLSMACATVAFVTAFGLEMPGLVYHAGVLLGLVVFAGTLLRWRIEAARTARRRAEDMNTPTAGAAARQFARLHGVSMLINLVLIVGVGALLWRWAGRMGSGG